MTDPKEHVGRDDSILYSGASSASFAKPLTEEAIAKKEEAYKKHKELKPAGEIVVSEIDRELTLLKFGVYPDEDKMTDELFRVERRARRLAHERLTTFKTHLLNVLRENKL
jgi:hypothetical protein